MSKKKKADKSLLTVRFRKGSGHPQIIIAADRVSFDSLNITHSPKHGRVNNIPLQSPLREGETRVSHVEKRKPTTDYKFRYSKALLIVPLTDEDVKNVMNYASKKKRH